MTRFSSHVEPDAAATKVGTRLTSQTREFTPRGLRHTCPRRCVLVLVCRRIAGHASTHATLFESLSTQVAAERAEHQARSRQQPPLLLRSVYLRLDEEPLSSAEGVSCPQRRRLNAEQLCGRCSEPLRDVGEGFERRRDTAMLDVADIAGSVRRCRELLLRQPCAQAFGAYPLAKARFDW